MRSLHINSFGGPDSLIVKESEIPKPGRGEVLVRVRASSLSFRDLPIFASQYQPPVQIGRVPLSDGAGEIEAVGEFRNRIQTVGGCGSTRVVRPSADRAGQDTCQSESDPDRDHIGLCQPEFIRCCVQERDRPHTNAMASARSNLSDFPNRLTPIATRVEACARCSLTHSVAPLHIR
jgi:hypothetical protein